MSSSLAQAYDFSANNVYFEITSYENHTVKVVGTYNDYSTGREVVIPSHVQDDSGTTYAVTAISSGALSSDAYGVGSLKIEDWQYFDDDDPSNHTLRIEGQGSIFSPYNYDITKIYIGRNLSYDASYGSEAPFYDLYNLKTVTIGPDVTELGDYLFYGSYQISTLICYAPVPPTCGQDALKSIPTWNCMLQVPAESFDAYRSAPIWSDFYNLAEVPVQQTPSFQLNGISYAILPNTNNVSVVAVENNHENALTDVPETVEYAGLTYTVTEIGDNAFDGCNQIRSIILPNTIVKINNNAFIGSNTLSMVIPKSVKSLGTNLFPSNSNSVCSYKVAVPRTLYYTDYSAVVINYPEDAIIVEDMWNSGVQYVYTGDMTKLLYASATNATGEMYSPSIDSRIETIGAYAFAISRVASVPAVQTIENNAFYFATLPGINLSSQTTEIGDSAFWGCSLRSRYSWTEQNEFHIVIPESVTHIGQFAFAHISNPGNGRRTVELNANITELPERVFMDSYINEISLPQTLVKIGNYALYVTGMESVTIPASVEYIGENALACSNLKSIICEGNIPPVCDNTFGYTATQEIALSVPLEAVDAYKEAPIWKDFLSRNGRLTLGNVVYTVADGATTATAKEIISQQRLYSVLILPKINVGDQEYAVTSINENILSDIPPVDYYDYYWPAKLCYPENCGFSAPEYHPIGYRFESTPYADGEVQADGSFYSADGTILYYVPVEAMGEYTVKESATTIADFAFSGCWQLNSVKMYDSVTSIGKASFSGCSELSEITLSEALESIDDEAFANDDKLQEITLPASLKHIGSSAFASDSKERVIYCHALVPPVCGQFAWPANGAEAQLFVPVSALDDYANNPEWSTYFTKIDPMEIVRIQETESTTNVDVYDLTGHCVARGVNLNTLRNLPHGIYISNGRKIKL